MWTGMNELLWERDFETLQLVLSESGKVPEAK